MIKYIAKRGNSDLVQLNTETLAVDLVNNGYYNRDWQWIIEQDGEFTYNDKTYPVKEGDIVIMLYSDVEFNGEDRTIVVLPAQAWREHSKAYDAWREARREHQCKDCGDCPEPCTNTIASA